MSVEVNCYEELIIKNVNEKTAAICDLVGEYLMGNLVFTQGLPIFDAIYDAFFHTTFSTSNGLYTTFPALKIVVNFRQATTYCGRFPQKSGPLKFRHLHNG